MVDQADERRWAQAEVERLEANLQNLVSLNASTIGIRLATEELDKARAALAAIDGELIGQRSEIAEAVTEDVVLADGSPEAEATEETAEPPMLEVVDDPAQAGLNELLDADED